MKLKFYNLLIIISSLFGYLEWGNAQHLFLFEAEAQIIRALFTNPASVIHPLTLMPLAGQLILLFTVFQKQPGKLLTYIGIGLITLLLGFMFFIGLLSMNPKILFSTIPFLSIVVLTLIKYKRKTTN